MEGAAVPSRDSRLREILDQIREEYKFRSVLLTDSRGLTISCSGDVKHAGIAAIAPEVIRIGEHAVRLGEYASINCVALVLENSHLMIIREVKIKQSKFIVAVDTERVPPGLRRIMAELAKRIAKTLES